MEFIESFVVPKKTVIFCHPAAVFKLDINIRRNAVFINEQKQEDNRSEGIYYIEEVKKAADSDKFFIVVNYSWLVALIFKLHLTKSDKHDIAEWRFMTFFHDDKDSGTGQKSQDIPLDLKRDVLIDMLHCNFLAKYTVPYGYTVTERDIKAIDEFWKEPDVKLTKEFKELSRKKREPHFPFYNGFVALREMEDKEEAVYGEAQMAHCKLGNSSQTL